MAHEPSAHQVLDTIAMRSLIAIADCGGFHRAAAALQISQSAVSQHVRRLEKVIGRPLVNRDGRTTRFTVDGHALLDEARVLVAAHDDALRRLTGTDRGVTVVGATEHAADQILPVVTAAMSRAYHGRQVRFRLDRTALLNEAVDQGTIDVAVYVSEASIAQGWQVGSLPLTWYSAPDWTPPVPGQPWPLIAIQEPCAIRARALEALRAEMIPAIVVCEAGYVAGVVNAARAGLGVALLANVGRAPEGLVRRDDLPPVAPVGLSARARRGLPPGMAGVITKAVGDLLRTTPAQPVADQFPSSH